MENEYKTNDLWLITSLLTYGILHKSIQQKQGDFKKWFIYDKTNSLNEAVAMYYSGQLNVQALQFKACYTQVLERVKSKEPEDIKGVDNG